MGCQLDFAEHLPVSGCQSSSSVPRQSCLQGIRKEELAASDGNAAPSQHSPEGQCKLAPFLSFAKVGRICIDITPSDNPKQNLRETLPIPSVSSNRKTKRGKGKGVSENAKPG
eukprot:TRINITY_DN20260_c0_g1_i1.p1 TRINITY_DN20260_c0_g1~~TRINITY_DN20260_c0_g1_i1.p1  ORF type:complete len:113 (-),score=9.78 TRINITY_DN20260_c0_g1_i1:108-446(-)